MGAELPAEPHKIVTVTIFLAIAGVSNWAALAYIHDIVGRTPLPDAIFSLIPQQAWALRVGDLMVTMCALSMITIFVFHKHRHIVIRRAFFYCWNIIYIENFVNAMYTATTWIY